MKLIILLALTAFCCCQEFNVRCDSQHTCLKGSDCCNQNGEWRCCRNDETLPVFLNDAPVKDCGSSSYHMHITSSTLTPSSPVAGKPAKLAMVATLDETVTTATYKMTVKMGGVPMYTHEGSFCGVDKVSLPLGGKLATTGLTCPAAAGSTNNLGMDVTLPTATPHATYTLILDAKDGDGNELMCGSATLKI